MRQILVATGVALALFAGGCGDADPAADADTDTDTDTEAADAVAESDRFPTVVAATVEMTSDGMWRFDVTISSPYDTPERYADAWRVIDPSGNELGIRVLTHDHANEQPFTRSLSGVEIPPDIDSVLVEPRDLLNGWSGTTFEVELGR